MDKSTIFNETISSNKNTNESKNFTESTLCDEIYDNLRALSLVHPFTDDFKSLFERGMFIRPNSKAFPHIFKYLFTILDANEFKKKFCWPVYNKAAEATFRNSTMEYLNKLNIKYNLGLGEIKNKILVFPGGMDFMRVIYELSYLAMQLVLKRNGINDPQSVKPMTAFEVNRHMEQLEDLCDFVLDLKKRFEDHSVQLKAKTELLRQLLIKVTANTSITPEDILKDEFTNSWAGVQKQIVEQGIQPDVKRLMKFQSDIQKLEEKIGSVFNHQTLKFDISALQTFSNEMQKLFPQHYQQMVKIIENDHINFDNLLFAFRLAIPTMLHSIDSYKPRSVEAMAYESTQLQKITEKADGPYPYENLQSIVLSTPTISQNAIKRVKGIVAQSKRISLIDGAYYTRTTMPTNRMLTKPLKDLQSDRSAQKLFLSPTRLVVKESKNKLDPMAILNTIKKKEKKDKHSSNSSFKMSSFSRFENDNQQNSSKSDDTVLSVPDFSSTLVESNDVFEPINSTLKKSRPGSSKSVKRPLLSGSCFEKTVVNVNSSPSGRLESLVLDLNLSDVKPLNGLKDVGHQETNLTLNASMVTESKSFVKKMDQDVDFSNIENNQNASNKFMFNLNNLIDANAESLLNISDRILDDINDSDLI